MRLLRDALQDLVEQEFDPVLRVAPVNGHDVEMLAQLKHDEIITCAREALSTTESPRSQEIKAWALQVTIPVTLTYMILDRCFSNLFEDTWLDFEDIYRMFKGVYLEKHVKKAMERLVRITHHKMYALDFVMESDGNGKYKISRRGSEEESKKEQDAKVEDDLLQVDFLDDAMVPVESGAENDEDGYDLVAGIDGEKLTPVKPSKGIDFRLTLFSHKVPTKAEQYEMIIGVKSDDSNISKRAGDKLIRNNARFIFWCAKKFDIYPDNDIFWDVFQEGALGLIRAAQKFNIEKGFKLSTYAGWWVRQFMSRYLARNKRLVHVEYWRMEIFNTIMKAVQEC